MLKHCKTAIILAGGKSSRMGFDKINIPINDERLLDHQIRTLKELFNEIIVVSNQMNDYQDQQVKVVADEYQNIGPLAGLHVGLKHASSQYAYIIACDMPYINLDFIKMMDELLTNFTSDVLVSKKDDFIEPFNAIYHQSVYRKIESFIDSNNKFGLRMFIKQINYQEIDKETLKSFEEKIFYNLNTVDDLKKYLG